MKIVVLASSSTGNSTYVEINNIKFLIDVGMPYSYIKEKLSSIDVLVEEIDFILITHSHSDHVKSLHTFSRINNTKVYIGSSTYDEYQNKEALKNYEFLDNINNIMGLDIKLVPISHDKKGFGFIITYKNKGIVYITDTGIIHSRYHELFKNKEVYLLESNHDVEMEMNGTKDEMTKIRNIGDTGHLSNDQCAMYLSRFVGDKTKAIVLMHISEHDNTSVLAYNTTRNSINKKIPIYLTYKKEISKDIII